MTRLPFPPEAQRGFGPRLVAHLTVGARVPRRTIAQILREVWGIRIALGSLQRLTEEASQGRPQPCDTSQHQLRHERVLHADETGRWMRGRRRWLWLLVARTFAVFVVATTRSAQVLEQVLGPLFAGILCTDRYSASVKYHTGTAQFCRAHLKRDLVGLATLSPGRAVDRFARDALALRLRLFRLWHRIRGGAFDRAQLLVRAIPIEQRLFALGEAHPDSDDRDVRALARVFYWHAQRLFAFIHHEGVEPTNNGAERAIRRAVLWRTICFGNRSEAGAACSPSPPRARCSSATCSSTSPRRSAATAAASPRRLSSRPRPEGLNCYRPVVSAADPGRPTERLPFGEVAGVLHTESSARRVGRRGRWYTPRRVSRVPRCATPWRARRMESTRP